MPPAPGFTVSDHLSIHALANPGGAPIERGMHVRWGFAADVGYPAEGFRLYRRESHGRHAARCLSIPPTVLLTVLQQGWASVDDAVVRVSPAGTPGAPPPAPGVSVPLRWRRFDVDLAEPVLLQRVSLQGQEGPAWLLGMLGGRPVTTRLVEGLGASPHVLFDYPVVDAVVVYTTSGGPEAVCFADAVQAASGEWSGDLLPVSGAAPGLGLPLTQPDYNLHHRFEDPAAPAAGDFREARQRLAGSGAVLAADDFDELRASLALMVDRSMPGRMFDREVFRTAEGASPFFERPLDLSLLFALDPAMARVAGLYHVDADVQAGTTYDYLLVGRWEGWQLPEPAAVYSFATVPEGTLVPRHFSLNGAAFTVPTRARVTSQPRVDGRQTRKALIVRDRSLFWATDGPATIRFSGPQRWALVELGPREGPVRVAAHRFGLQVDVATVPAGEEPLTVLLRASSGSLTELELNASGYALYGLRALPAAAPGMEPTALDQRVTLGALVLNVAFEDAPALPAPTGLRLRGLPMPTSEQPALTLDEAEPPLHDDPQGLGLRWVPAPALGAVAWPADLGRRPPTEAVGYELRHQFLGDGDTPRPVDPSRWVAASDGPVSVALPAAQDQEPEAQPLTQGEDLSVRFPATAPPLAAQFPPDADLWLVPWVPEGWYAGEVRAVDAFGRTSAWAGGGPTLADAVTAPPPPAGVRATLLQSADPELDADERVLVARHGDGCIRVSWEWPASLRRQAPHARGFRVYLNRRAFNRRQVRIVSVGPGPTATELACEVEMDDGNPPAPGGLAGANLVDGDRVAFRIVADTAGPATARSLTLRRHVVETALQPPPGPGVVVLHPGSPAYEHPAVRQAWEARVAEEELTAASQYEVVLPPLGLDPSRAAPLRHGAVGVATADGAARAPDTFVQPAGPPWDPALGGMPGREGGVSAPVGIVARLFAPLPVAAPAPRDRLYTTPPDFFGRCTYELRWPHVAAAIRPMVGWKLYRTTDRAVFGLYHPDPALSRIDTTALSPADQADLAAAFPTERAAAVTDDVIRRLAGQPGADRAFTTATDRPLRTASDTVTFVDGVDGRNTVRYLWRMRTEDDAGNLSPLGEATDPVYVPNTYPPGAVKVSECRGGERRVQLSWSPNHEEDVAGYLVFSTETGMAADSVETLRLLRRATGPEQGTVEAYDRAGSRVLPVLDLGVAAAGDLLQDGLVVVAREGLAGGRVFHYRVAAYDTHGNPSALSRVFTARTTGIHRPPPPQWGPPVRQADGLHLSWTAPTDDLNCLLQRSPDGERWVNVGGWLGRGNYAAVDPDHPAAAAARYRLRVMAPNGQVNRDFVELVVSEP